MILCFELTMPNRGSYNGKWSQEQDKHYIMITYRTKAEIEKYSYLDGKDFYHRWDDGWTACISCSIIDFKEAAKRRKINRGFCGYDWMVSSILKGNVDEHNSRIIHEE
jgi:hypothetical protein